jgi:hypothetical protein
MPTAPAYYTSGLAGVVALSTNVEKVVATLTGIDIEQYARSVRLVGRVLDTSGSTTTAVVLRIRQGTLTGAVVGDQTGQSVITAAADTNIYETNGIDSGVAGTGITYVLTVQHTGGGTGGTTVYSTLDATVY